MTSEHELGKIVILNGPPRSGKSTMATKIQEQLGGIWMNFGVDQMMNMTPMQYQPGIGLRPGGERPDLEPIVEKMYLSLYHSIASFSRTGLNVVVDVGHHNFYRKPLNLLPRCMKILENHPVAFVGVFCQMDELMNRRIKTWGKGYDENGEVPEPVEKWQKFVHEPGIYDLEINTSILNPDESVAKIQNMLSRRTFGVAKQEIINGGSKLGQY